MDVNGKSELLKYSNNEVLKTTSYLHNDQKTENKNLSVHEWQSKIHTPHPQHKHAARIMSSYIFRAFKTREEHCMKTLWKAVVLPRLEYCQLPALVST